MLKSSSGEFIKKELRLWKQKMDGMKKDIYTRMSQKFGNILVSASFPVYHGTEEVQTVEGTRSSW